MPFVKIWIHAVWATKSRRKLLHKEIRPDVFEHIHQNALKKEIFMDCVNGHIDHVHCLFRLKNDQTISKIMQLIKGESSHWVNNKKLIETKFDCRPPPAEAGYSLRRQDEYFAVSVSESQVNAVRKYILNQEEHHHKKTFKQEYDEFIQRYGFQIFKDES